MNTTIHLHGKSGGFSMNVSNSVAKAILIGLGAGLLLGGLLMSPDKPKSKK